MKLEVGEPQQQSVLDGFQTRVWEVVDEGERKPFARTFGETADESRARARWLVREYCGFGFALMQLRQGKHLRRRGWDGQGMHIELYPGATRPDGLWLQPHILMRTVQGTMVPWLASQSDLLAEDWEVCA